MTPLRHTLFLLLFVTACGVDGPGIAGDDVALEPATRAVSQLRCVVALGDDVAPVVRQRLLELLRQVPELEVEQVSAETDVRGLGADVAFGFGDTAVTRLLISRTQVTRLGSEGYVIAGDAPSRVFAAWGNARGTTRGATLGNGFGAYALLEHLGFEFLHPLAPRAPGSLRPVESFTVEEKPALALRGIHLHTMHPIELTHVLNGWGPGGPEDAEGFAALTGEWSLYLEWLLANRQNTVEWVLLEADAWLSFSRSDERRDRLALLNAMADKWGVTTLASAGLRLRQQHGFRLIPDGGDAEAQHAQLRASVDWLALAGFDGVSTEAGTSEFTHEAAELMLSTMDELTRYTHEQYGMPAFIKVHASTGQNVPGYVDPVSGGELNINFLPYYADPRLAVLPHTVQHYGIDDPAPTYGNNDFTGMLKFARAAAEKRPVVWYPETAYWVSFDVDVPLFLPVYAERRVHDLRLMASEGVALDGQMLFSSGWEWGYWLNDVVAARAAWDPRDDALSDADAFADILREVFVGSTDALVNALVGVAAHQHALLILGQHGGAAPASVVRRNGQAYLQGFEAFDDVADLASDLGVFSRLRTQPDKLGLVELRNPFHAAPMVDDIDDLLRAMERTFAMDAAALESLAASDARAADLGVAMRMTALRSEQVHSLYSFADGRGRVHLANARRALDRALVLARGYTYRADAERLAGWGPNPTAYRFGYLWTARTLYYWFRDEAKADVAPVSPCYLNILDFFEIGFGEGLDGMAADVARTLSAMPGVSALTACLVDPLDEPRLGDWR